MQLAMGFIIIILVPLYDALFKTQLLAVFVSICAHGPQLERLL